MLKHLPYEGFEILSRLFTEHFLNGTDGEDADIWSTMWVSLIQKIPNPTRVKHLQHKRLEKLPH